LFGPAFSSDNEGDGPHLSDDEEDIDVYDFFYPMATSQISSKNCCSSSDARFSTSCKLDVPLCGECSSSSEPAPPADVDEDDINAYDDFNIHLHDNNSFSDASDHDDSDEISGCYSDNDDIDIYDDFLIASSVDDRRLTSSHHSNDYSSDDGDDSAELSEAYSDDEEDEEAVVEQPQQRRRGRASVFSTDISLAGIKCNAGCGGSCLDYINRRALVELRERAHSSDRYVFLKEILERAFFTRDLTNISFKGKLYPKKAGILAFAFDELSAPICENAALLYLNLYLPCINRRQPKRIWRELHSNAVRNDGKIKKSSVPSDDSTSKNVINASKLMHAKAFISNYVLDSNYVDTSPYAGEETTLIIPYKRLSYFYGEYEQTYIEKGFSRKTYASLNTFGRAYKALKFDCEGHKLSFSNGKGTSIIVSLIQCHSASYLLSLLL
jgi:hypothetical protein